jgi:wyosine [tRNA(Phe)-imidazoG37] synthetase (radical SAM superfamily)
MPHGCHFAAVMDGQYRFLFGPVRSRRLGRSLGIDLVPFKVCTFDCPYCQVGATVTKTLERGEYVPTADVLAEFDHWLAHDGQADCLTLAGAGEPTLHSRFGDILQHIGARCAIRRVLLSNGSLFHLKSVRDAAKHADVVKATLGAWDQSSFEAVHHPCDGLQFEEFFSGLKAMRAEFSGEYWLEVFLVAGVNDGDEDLARLVRLAGEIKPDRIHLNTAVRPPHDMSIKPVTQERLLELARRFKPEAEVIASQVDKPTPNAPMGTPPVAGQVAATKALVEDRVLQLIRRHPCTAEELTLAIGLDKAQVTRALESLVAKKVVRLEWRDGKPYMVGNG